VLADRNCLACGSDSEVWLTRRDRTMRRCQKCGLLWVPEGLATVDGVSIYEQDSPVFFEDGRDDYYLDDSNFLNFEEKDGWVRGFAPDGELLDVGSAFGHFAAVAQRHRPVTAIELSPVAVQWASATLQVNMRRGSIYDEFPDFVGRFSAVTLWDVIEHVPDPERALRAARTWLRPGGWLFMSTPDARQPGGPRAGAPLALHRSRAASGPVRSAQSRQPGRTSWISRAGEPLVRARLQDRYIANKLSSLGRSTPVWRLAGATVRSNALGAAVAPARERRRRHVDRRPGGFRHGDGLTAHMDESLDSARRAVPLAAISAVAGLALLAYAISRPAWPRSPEGCGGSGAGFLASWRSRACASRCRTWGWMVCIEGQPRLRFFEAFEAKLIGDALGNLTPMGLFVSEPAKAMLVRRTVHVSNAVPAMLIENMVCALSGVVMIGLGALAVLVACPCAGPLRPLSVALLAGAVVTIGASGWLMTARPGLMSGFAGWLHRAGLVPHRLHAALDRVRSIEERVFGFASRHPGRVPWLLLLMLAFHLVTIGEGLCDARLHHRHRHALVSPPPICSRPSTSS
jgi:2-polyprenyl-3-methyl-5-hydroxy-6-metoxy-1,4-benzoquinol methylase